MRASLRVLAVVVVLASALAFAGWRTPTTVNGTPYDVQVTDAGIFTVTAQGAGATNSAFATDGGGFNVFAQIVANASGAWIPSGGCLTSVFVRSVNQTCAYPSGALLGTTHSAVAARTTQSGRAYVGMRLGTSGPATVYTSPSGGTVSDWVPLVGLDISQYALLGSPLSALRVGAADYAVFGGNSNAVIFRDSALLSALDLGGPAPTDLWLYEGAGKPSAAVIVNGNLLYVPDINAPAVGRTSVPVPAAAGTTNTVSFNWNEGSDAGRGFGMLTGSNDMWGAVPDPTGTGANWIVRSGPGWGANELKRVACYGAKFCAAIRNVTGSPNVAWYFNDSPPAVMNMPSPTVPEGSSVTIAAVGADSDGDPVYFTWAVGALNGAALTVTPTGALTSNAEILISTTDAGTFCSPSVTVAVTPTISDGWAAHDTVGQPGTITVQRTRGISPPTIGGPPLISLDTAAAALTPVTASAASVGCPPQGYQWSLSPGAMGVGIGLVTDGGATALLDPPAGFCGTDAGPFAVSVIGLDPVANSTSVSTNVQVVRTTPPLPPSVGPPLVTINPAGVPAVASATPPGSGCPPQSYQWTLSVGAMGAGISLVSDGGLNALLVPPATFCGVTAGPFAVNVASVDAVGTSATVSTNVQLVRTTPPSTPVVMPTMIALGASDSGFALTASPGDGGCAPQSYAWSLSDPLGTGATLMSDGGPVARLLSPSGFCAADGGAAVATVTVQAVDPVGTSAGATVAVTVSSNGAPGAPTVTPPMVSLRPGGPPAKVNAQFASTGCVGQDFAWTFGLGTDAGLGFSVDGGELTVVPPPYFCSPDAGQFSATVRATNAFDASVPVPVPITLKPWGPPFAPIFAPATVLQDAGTSRQYAAGNAEHFCQSTAGFPSVLTDWSLDSGVPGVTLTATANAATVTAPDCVSGTAVLSAQRYLANDPANRSGLGSLTIDIGTYLAPIGADAGISVTTVAAPGAGVRGVVDYSGFNCPGLRNVTAQIDIVPAGGGPVVASGAFDAGPWSLSIAGGCNGGSYTGAAQLLENGQPTGTRVSLTPFSLPQVGTAVGPLNRDTLPVTCESGLDATLELAQVPGTCTAAETVWERRQGSPPLEQDVLRGTTVSVRSPAGTGLDELVGQSLVWDVTVDAGGGNLAQEQRSVRLVTEPFITVTHQPQQLRFVEGETLGVQATLVSSASCAVRSLVIKSSLASLSYLEGSARLDGRTVPARVVEDGVLEVGPVALDAHATAKLTWLGRVPLSPKIAFSTEAVLNGQRVSVAADAPAAPARACGCSTSTAGSLVWLTLFAAGYGFRRRVRSKRFRESPP